MGTTVVMTVMTIDATTATTADATIVAMTASVLSATVKGTWLVTVQGSEPTIAMGDATATDAVPALVRALHAAKAVNVETAKIIAVRVVPRSVVACNRRLLI
jgi:hypothetical protein